MLVKAGSAVDAFIEQLMPFLEKGDIIIDGGNSEYTDSQVGVVTGGCGWVWPLMVPEIRVAPSLSLALLSLPLSLILSLSLSLSFSLSLSLSLSLSQRRCKTLEAKGILFVGSGVSGGEDGARYGPSLMPGGSPAAWPHIKPIFQGISAKANE